MDEEDEFWGGDVWDGGEDEDEGDKDEGDVDSAGVGGDSDEESDNFDVRWYVSDMLAASDRFAELEETGDSYTGVDGGYWGEFQFFYFGICELHCNLYI